MGRRVYAIGEAVLDIIFKDNIVQGATPGGAMLNSAVSLSRAGINVSLITEVAKDQTGAMVESFLNQNNILTNLIYKHSDGKTAIALAFLSDVNDASYLFYKNHPSKRLQIEVPEFTPDDILLFGSYYSIDPSIRQILLPIIMKAKQNGSMIVYDPNFRKPHTGKLELLRPYIMENISMADIVRGSDEDFMNIFGVELIDQVRHVVGNCAPVIIMTNSSKAVYLNIKNFTTEFPVQKITPVSTIGAGDNFNAGIIYGLIKENIYPASLNKLNAEKWETLVSYGVTFASDVCKSYENYISKELAETLRF